MSHFPTSEEEFELMYGEELEMMNEMDGMAFLYCRFNQNLNSK